MFGCTVPVLNNYNINASVRCVIIYYYITIDLRTYTHVGMSIRLHILGINLLIRFYCGPMSGMIGNYRIINVSGTLQNKHTNRDV